LLHDIGKIGIDERILRKPGRLTEEEFSKIKAHPAMGADIVSHIKQLASISSGIKHHHERFDGRGYPEALKGAEIPLSARIIAVCDTFDAMTSDRPYRKGLDPEVAIGEIERFSGSQFDAKCAEAFVRAYRKGRIKVKK
jgi:HD-GYP domain-containing protein (c-di-GMP phosphodiesterase class II)